MRAQHFASIAVAILVSLSAGAQVSLSPIQAPGVTAPAPQAHSPQGGGRQPLTSPIEKSPGTVPNVQLLNGELMGYVYWDASMITSNVSSPCSFVVRINQGTPPSGGAVGFEQFTEVGTYQNKFTSVGKVGKYTVCQYAVNHLPEGKDLQVQVAPTKGALQTAVVFTIPPTANDPNGPIKIVGGKCNQLPPAVPSLATLGSAWWTCGDYAYNVNYVMQPPQNIPGLTQNPGTITVVQSQTLLPASGGTNGMINPGPQQKTLLSSSGPTTGMVNPGPPQNPGAVSPGPINMPQNPVAVNPGPTQTGGMTNVASGHNADDLNPQPFPPKSISATGSSAGVPRARVSTKTAALAAIKLSAPQQSRKITNPNAGMQNAQIIAVLQKQTQAANAEIAAMKLSLRPAGAQVGSSPAQIMAATGTGGPSTKAAPVQANLLASNGASTGHSSIGAVMPAQFQNLAITCSHDPTMRVLTVSGGQSSAVFTQDAKYNFYTLSGCSFGDIGQNAKAYIYSQGTFREDFQIEQWSDNWIKLSIDPSLKGIDDQDNVTLVIQREDGKQASKGGFRFYAARETILLPKIPQSDFSLNHFRPDNAVTNSWTPTYTSASSGAIVPNLPGMSAEVQWTLSTEPDGTLVGGSDLYDFSHLHSTFALQNALMEWEDLSCGGGDYQFAASKGKWGIDWYGNAGVQVSWQGQTCNPTPGSCGGTFQGDCFVGPPESNYGVDVWVTGPRGIDPWTGKPVA
jgi:hypothetical protein